MAVCVEKELHFTFPEELKWIELDKRGTKLPIGMSFVDLVIERDTDVLMIEIKDPSHTCTPPENRAQYLRKRDTKPLKYIVLLGLDAFDIKEQKALLGNFKDRLFQNVKKEMAIPWEKEYLQDCIVMNIDIWNASFPQWQVHRISSGAN